MMNLTDGLLIAGLSIPFIGTTAGAASVFFLREKINPGLQCVLNGFAAGVMVAASVWSLLLPAMDLCSDMGKLGFLPALIGFMTGVFLLAAHRPMFTTPSFGQRSDRRDEGQLWKNRNDDLCGDNS